MTVAIDRANIEDIYELSPLQQGLLFHTLEEHRGGVYVEQLSGKLVGPLDTPAFERAWQTLLGRHPALRSAFYWEDLDKPVQVVWRRASVPIERDDWSRLSTGEQGRQTEHLLAHERIRPFDLGRPPLMRLRLVRLAPDRHLFVWTHHHLLIDGWSLALLLDELVTLYAGPDGEHPARLPVRRPYGDFIKWLRRFDAASARAFWGQRLNTFAGSTPVPFDRRASTRAPSAAEPYEVTRLLGGDETMRLDRWCRDERLTMNTVVQGAWAALVGRLTDRRSVVYGCTVAGRPPELEGSEAMVGLFINTVPVSVEVTAVLPAAEWLRDLQQRLADIRQFEHSPLTRVHEWAGLPRGTSLFETLFVFENYPAPRARAAMGRMRVEEVRSHERTHYPLTLVAAPGPQLGLRILADPSRLDRDDAQRLLVYLEHLLVGMPHDGSRSVADLAILPDAERDRLESRHRTEAPYSSGRLVPDLIAEHASLRPNAPALVAGRDVLTYADLNARANRLSHHLMRHGVSVESRVGVCLRRSTDAIVALLGVLKCGAAYVPFDPTYPAERLAFMADNAGLAALVTETGLRARCPEGRWEVLCVDEAGPVIDRPPNRLRQGYGGPPELHAKAEGGRYERYEEDSRAAQPDSLAYVIYTSGSTGRPKGVAISHRSLLNLIFWHHRAFGTTARDHLSHLASPGFDASVWEIWPCLAAGATLHLAPEDLPLNPVQTRHWLLSEGITAAFAPTPLAEELLALEWPADAPLGLLLTGGDRLTRFSEPGWPFRLVNNYGPTEYTVVASSGPVPERSDDPAAPGIGRPISNTRAYVLDGRLQPVPDGIAGELYLAGAGLARGYWAAPDQTAERFLPDPLSREPGARMYRTGDRVRFLPDGELEFLGRADDQVKLRGFRIELGEIETVLRRCPTVRDGAVALREDHAGRRQLVAYYVTEGSDPSAREPAADELRDHLRAALPEYMVPTAWVRLAALPLTPHGKIDRKALPAPAPAIPGRPPDPLKDPTEDLLSAIWQELLDVERAEPDDDFFALGGHSLMLLRLHSRVRATWPVEIPLGAFFEHSTLRSMAGLVRDASVGPLAPRPLIVGREAGQAPLSFAQERLWFLEQLPKSAEPYNVSLAFRIHGEARADLIERAVIELIGRHHILRTSFHAEHGQPVQRVDPAATFTLPSRDLKPVADEHRMTELDRLFADETARPFDLTRAPLLRALLAHLTDCEHALLFTVHHIVSDGWSMAVLGREFTALYAALRRGETSSLPALAAQYADVARWQRESLAGEDLDRLVGHWCERLVGVPVLELPTDRPRPPVQSYRGRTETFEIPERTVRAIRALARRERCTLFMVGFAAFTVLLSRYGRQDDFAVGTPIAGRDLPETEDLIGCFVNTLALRVRPRGDRTFRDYLADVRSVALDAYAHAQLPFEQLVQAISPQRDLGHAPLFQTMFVWQNMPATKVSMPDGEWEGVAIENGSAKFDVTMSVTESTGPVAASIEYCTDLFEAATIRRMIGHYLALLDAVAEDPGRPLADLPLLGEAERDAIVVGFNRTEQRYPTAGFVHERIEAEAERTPHAPAVVFGGAVLTYAALNDRANRLARRLRRLGVGPETLVGVYLERSIDLVVSLLAILKTGAAYVPLDPGYPADRIAFMAADADARVIITNDHLCGRLPALSRGGLTAPQGGASGTGGAGLQPRDPSTHVMSLDAEADVIAAETATNLNVPVHGSNLAYVIYTSGSTGRPKGAMNTHEAILNRLLWMQQEFGPDTSERVLQKTPFSFDISVWEFFWPLMTGATLVVAEPELHRDPVRLAELVERDEITTIHFVPSMLAVFIDAAGVERCRSLRRVICSGEALSADLVARCLAKLSIPLFNLYGPTEAAVEVTSWQCDKASSRPSVPIGTPIANVRLYVLDTRLEPVPIGVPGELYIGGAAVGRGYHARPDLTAARFIPDPFGRAGGERLYRTGDLVRYRPDGAIEFLGRLDDQIKLRGHRIELGEIEALLAAQPGVKQAVVSVREDEPGDRRLVAYVVPDETPSSLAGPDAASLRAALQTALPEYMVPSAFVFLDRLPLSPAGKLDRRALPAPSLHRAAARASDPPATLVEEALAGLWAELLRVPHVGRHDSFFDLGGHSLIATQLVARVGERFRVQLPVLAIFEAPTLATFADAIVRAEPSPGHVDRVAKAWLALARMTNEEKARLLQEPRG